MAKKIDMEDFFQNKKIQGKIFDTQTIMQFLWIPHQNTIQNIWYRVKKWKIIRLRKNCFYIPTISPNIYHIANQIIKPSYVSLDTILSKYSIIPDVVYTIFSVTTRNKINYKNKFGNFGYKTLKKSMMFGFEEKDWALVATKEKALIDYLYLNMEKITLKQKDYKNIDKKNYKNSDLISLYKYFQSERFANLDILDFEKLLEYAILSKKKKLVYITKLLKYYKNSDYYENFL